MAAAYKAGYKKALSWGELYANSSIEGKKMIIWQLIKKTGVRTDYFELNLSYKQFETLLNRLGAASKRARKGTMDAQVIMYKKNSG